MSDRKGRELDGLGNGRLNDCLYADADGGGKPNDVFDAGAEGGGKPNEVFDAGAEGGGNAFFELLTWPVLK